MWNDLLLTKMLFFSAKAHGNQKMKSPADMPYLAHVVAVMQFAVKYALLSKLHIDWNLLVASALLHDTLEDTPVTFKELENEFGENVANGVFALTRNAKLEKDKQIPDCINKIKKQPIEVAIVKMADRLFNIRKRVPSWSADKQECYKNEAQLICDELGYACAPLKEALQTSINRY